MRTFQRISSFPFFFQDAHEFLNFLLNELVDILEKEESNATKIPPEASSSLQSGEILSGDKKEPLVTWVHKNFQVSYFSLWPSDCVFTVSLQ